jgi:hypothetical protein
MSLLKLVDGLKTKLSSVAELPGDVLTELENLRDTVSDFEGIDPNSARTAISEVGRLRADYESLKPVADQVDTLTSSVNDLTTANQDLQRSLLASRTVNQAGILPEFQGLLEPVIAGAAQLNDQTKAFELPDGYLGQLQEQYPSAFMATEGAGTGGAGVGSDPDQDSQPSTVKVENGVVSGVDPSDVLAGKVQLTR